MQKELLRWIKNWTRWGSD